MNKLQSYKERDLDFESQVEIYRCLNRPGTVYSVRQNNLVVGHTKDIIIEDVEFYVSKKSQDRARSEKSRNIHAWAIGKVVVNRNLNFKHRVGYNPFKWDSFVIKTQDNKPIQKSKFARFNQNGCEVIL